MLPDEMEAEKNRKIIVAQAEQIEVLKKNVYDLQEQLQAAYKRIEDLTNPRDPSYKWWEHVPVAPYDIGSK